MSYHHLDFRYQKAVTCSYAVYITWAGLSLTLSKQKPNAQIPPKSRVKSYSKEVTQKESSAWSQFPGDSPTPPNMEEYLHQGHEALTCNQVSRQQGTNAGADLQLRYILMNSLSLSLSPSLLPSLHPSLPLTFWDKVLPRSTNYTWIHYVAKAGLKLVVILLPQPRVTQADRCDSLMGYSCYRMLSGGLATLTCWFPSKVWISISLSFLFLSFAAFSSPRCTWALSIIFPSGLLWEISSCLFFSLLVTI